jgi:hypothetical protein
VKQQVSVDFVATNGTSVVFGVGLTAGDLVDIVAYGAFDIANVYTQTQSDARYLQKAGGTMSGAITYAAGQTTPVINGGTGQTSALTQYGMVYAASTSAMASTGAGTTTTLLHGNASGAPTFGAVALGTDVSGTLPVANGGTGLTAGTSGGVLAYTASGTLASSGALTQYGVVLGGGAGAVPTSTAVGTATHVLTSNGSGVAPTFQALPASGPTTIELFYYANANA